MKKKKKKHADAIKALRKEITRIKVDCGPYMDRVFKSKVAAVAHQNSGPSESGSFEVIYVREVLKK